MDKNLNQNFKTSIVSPPELHEKKLYVQQEGDTCLITITLESLTQTLAQALWLSGKISPVPLCSGLGRCGACKVRFMSSAPLHSTLESEVLGESAIGDGWRLACRHTLENLYFEQDGIHLYMPAPAIKKKHVPFSMQDHKHTQCQPATLSIDLGTTSFCWQLLDINKQIANEGKELNPQMGAGSDIISRIQFGTKPQGAQLLARVVREKIQDILHNVAPAYVVQEIGLAANTAMTALFLEKDVQGLAHAPYSLPLTGHSHAHVHGLPPIYLPPALAPFVGSDISAGYAALMARKNAGENVSFPFLLADLGTNGEFILAVNEREAFITSVPMGPALEGIGLSHGHMADESAGIVHAVRLGPTGLQPQTIDGTVPQKICGTGYISLIHALLKVGLLTETGLFTKQPAHKNKSPFFIKLAASLTQKNERMVLNLWQNMSPSPMYLYAHDVEEILKVKASFSFAMAQLLKHAGLAPAQLQHIYIAGAMGQHVHIADLEGLGFVPQGAGARIISLGNSALEGMSALLLDDNLREHIYQWSKGCALVNLTEDEHFTEKFMQHMNFSYAG